MNPELITMLGLMALFLGAIAALHVLQGPPPKEPPTMAE